MNVFICCDAFKGTLSSKEVNNTIYQQLSGIKGINIIKKELADGGEGSLDIVKQTVKGLKKVSLPVYSPLGRPVNATYFVNDTKAYIEIAQASGINLLSSSELDPLKANSYGTGQQVLHAINNGCKEIDLFMGGSATVDGGTGILAALTEMTFVGNNYLFEFENINLQKVLKAINTVKFRLICDVSNPPLGTSGAVQVFAPQKGANDAETLNKLDRKMQFWLNYLSQYCTIDLSKVNGLGAAGAIGLPFKALASSEIIMGYEYFSQLLNYDSMIEWCDLLITGEGCIDHQTSMGKGPGKLAKDACKKGKYVIGIGGKVLAKPKYFNTVFSTIENTSKKELEQIGAKARLIQTLKYVKEYLV